MSTQNKRLYRSNKNRMIAGICGGLGDYFNIDPTIIRLIFVFGAFITGSGLFWAYLIMMIVVPEDVPASRAVVEAPIEDIVPEEDL